MTGFIVKKTSLPLILGLLILGFLILYPYQAQAESDGTRIFGSGRVETALEICKTGWTSAEVVILAPADQANLVDSLAAAALAGQEKAPILLTFKDSLDPKVGSAISSLGASKVYVVGGITEQVAAKVKAIPGVSVEVLKGSNRWATVQAINNKLINPAGTFVVGYNALPDALSVASYAAKNRYAIILADTEGKIPAGQSILGSKTYIIGGPSLVKDIPGAVRIYGKDRYETNAKIAEVLEYSYQKVFVANGLNNHLVDSLTAAPLAGNDGAFIALSDGRNIYAAKVVNQKINHSTSVIALGGPSLISEEVRNSIRKSSTPFRVESLRALSSTQLEIKFNKKVAKDSILISPGYDKLKPGLLKIERDPYHDGEKDIDADYMYAELSQDGTTLSLRVHRRTFMDGKYLVTINPGVIVAADYGEELERFSDVITVKDTVSPTVKKLSYNPATNRIEILMSEVCEILPNVAVNNDSIQLLTEEGSGALLSFPNKWDRNEVISVQISGSADYAGNKQLEAYKETLRIPLDLTPLALISAVQTDSNVFDIVFNKPIAPYDDDNWRVKNVKEALVVLRNGAPISISDIDLIRDDRSKCTYRVILDPSGAPDYKIYLGKPSITLTAYIEESKLLDVYGNSNLEIYKDFLMTKDSTGPKLANARLTWGGEAFILRFDEDIPDLELLEGITVRKSGVDITNQFNIMPIKTNTPNSREIKIVYRTGGVPIEKGTYTISLDENVLPDKHLNYNQAQNIEIIVR